MKKQNPTNQVCLREIFQLEVSKQSELVESLEALKETLQELQDTRNSFGDIKVKKRKNTIKAKK